MIYKMIFDNLLKMGAERRQLTFRGSDAIRTVDAVVLSKIENCEGRQFQSKHLPFSREDKALLVLHMHTVRAFSVEELDSLPMEQIRKLSRAFGDIWLIDDDSLECQLHLLELCKYSDGSAKLNARLSEASELMREIFALEPFRIRMLMEEYVGFDFVSEQPLRGCEKKP